MSTSLIRKVFERLMERVVLDITFDNVTSQKLKSGNRVVICSTPRLSELLDQITGAEDRSVNMIRNAMSEANLDASVTLDGERYLLSLEIDSKELYLLDAEKTPDIWAARQLIDNLKNLNNL